METKQTAESPQPAAAAPDALFARIARSLARQGLMLHLGAELRAAAPGSVALWLPYSEKVTQQQGGFHGGAMAALADIAGGYAGLTLAPEGQEVVTVEMKINFLNSFQGGGLRATGRVVKPGRRLIITTAEVTHVAADGTEKACALMQQTLMYVPQTY